jgi:hypothetical protein
MAQAVRAGSVLQPSRTKYTLLQQRSLQPTPELVVACYTGDEATVRRYLQDDALNLDYQVSQMLCTLSSLRFVDLRSSIVRRRQARIRRRSCEAWMHAVHVGFGL